MGEDESGRPGEPDAAADAPFRAARGGPAEAGADAVSGIGRFVPVLLYHGVTTAPSGPMAPFAVAPDVFAGHLDLLLDEGFEPVTMSAFMAARTAGTAAGRRLALITFDDGFADFASNALPRLLERGIPASLYVTTGWLDGRRGRLTGPPDPFLSWSELPAIRDAGIEVGAHTHSHPQLDTLSRRMILEELRGSKAMLEDALSAPVVSVAYPHGYNDPRVRRIAHEVGYESGAAVDNRLASSDGDAFRIPRLMLGPGDSVAELRRLLSSPPASGARALVRWSLRMGWRTYRRSKAVATGRPGRAW
ncbi:MAG TPA: polysaccharide deacetylase family protein [Blastococcus sp.]|nr:polysaccharide deacetylase family protein [Blastococcus sp.]